MSRKTRRSPATIIQPQTSHGLSDSPYRIKAEGVNRATIAAVQYIELEHGVNLPTKGSYRQQTTPSEYTDSQWGGTSVGDWKNYPEIVRREEYLTGHDACRILRPCPVEPWRALRAMPRLSSIVAQALRLMKRTCNTEFVISFKNQDANGRYTIEDDEANEYVRNLFKQTGTRIVSDIPGAAGDFNQHNDDMFTSAFTMGNVAQELVLKQNRKDFSHLALVETPTLEFHRDLKNPSAHLLGQKRADAENGWLQLNPNLVTFRAVNGTGLGNIYGECEYLTAFSIAPIWQGYFGKLAMYIQRAAFGFLDGVVKVEILEKMWVSVTPANRAPFRNDFMVWANAMVAYLGQTYKAMGEADPESLMIHLDILEINATASGKTSFPTTEAAEVILDEYFNAIGAPGELFGKNNNTPDHVHSARMETYSKNGIHYQEVAAALHNRAGYAALWAKGHPRKVEGHCYFKKPQMYDRLRMAQAEQIEQLIARFKRDEGLISQDEMSNQLQGRPALAQHSLAKYPDKSGDSTPDREVLLPRQAAKDSAHGMSGASAGGTAESADAARGGANKTRQSDPEKNKNK